MTFGQEIVRLLNAAMAVSIPALVLWLLVLAVLRGFKKKVTSRSAGLFVIILAVLTVLQLFYLAQSEQFSNLQSASAATAADSISTTDAATFEANAPQLKSIIAQVVNGRAVDRQTHDLFWSLIPSSMVSTPERRQLALDALNNGLKFQRAFWESVLLSAQAHQVVRTQAYEDGSSQVALAGNNKDKSDAMLQAAASGQPYVSSNGQTLTLNEAYAKEVLSRLDANSAQLDVLYNPSWHQ